MAYTTEYVDGGKGVIKVGSGTVSGAEILSGIAEDRRYEDRARQFVYGLVDFSEVTELRINAREISFVAVQNLKTAVLTPRALVAVIAPTREVSGWAHMWQIMAADTGWKTHVCQTRAEGLDWIRGQMTQGKDAATALADFPYLQ